MPQTTPHVKNGDAKASQMDFEVFLSLLFLGKRVILICLLLVVGVTAIMSLLTPAKYESTVKVLAEPPRENNPQILEVESHQDRRVFIETQKELVVSDSVLRGTVAKVRGVDAVLVTDDDIDRFARQVSVTSRAGFAGGLFQSDGIGESNTFFVSVRDGDPEEAAQKANLLVETYFEYVAELRRGQAVRARSSLEASVEQSTQLTKQAHQRLVAFEKEAGPLLPELINLDKPTIRVYPELEQLRQDYQTARVELQERRKRFEVLEAALDAAGEDAPPIPVELIQANPTLQLLRDREVGFLVELNELRPFFTSDSREIKSLQEKITLTRQKIAKELREMVQGEKMQLGILAAAQEEREKALVEYDERLAELSAYNSEYAELKREYNSLAHALETQMEALSAAVAESSKSNEGGANLAVIDPATPGYDAVSPRIVRNIALSLPLGLGLGVLLVLLGHLARPVFVHPRQLARATGLPVVGVYNHKMGQSS